MFWAARVSSLGLDKEDEKETDNFLGGGSRCSRCHPAQTPVIVTSSLQTEQSRRPAQRVSPQINSSLLPGFASTCGSCGTQVRAKKEEKFGLYVLVNVLSVSSAVQFILYDVQ